MGWYRDWRPYVSVAQRRAQAAVYAAKLAKKSGRALAPVKIEGRKIASTFWGQAWCDNLEQYSDFENRLPRGRTYVRNGSVIDLAIERGKVKAIVSGSQIYRVTVTIKTLPRATWNRIKTDCSQSIDSLIDLLRGRFDQGVMQRLTDRDGGLFPKPQEIDMTCSCPDWADMCKHVAATLYGVGARLDTDPELLFTLRDVDHLELVSEAVAADNLDRTLAAAADGALAGSDLGEIFGIELDAGARTPAPAPRRRLDASRTRRATDSNGNTRTASTRRARSAKRTRARAATASANAPKTAAATHPAETPAAVASKRRGA